MQIQAIFYKEVNYGKQNRYRYKLKLLNSARLVSKVRTKTKIF